MNRPAPPPLKVFDTYLRALAKCAAMAPQVRALEDEVASREAEVLRKVLALVEPVFPRLAETIVLAEPWLDRGQGEGKALREAGLVLVRNFDDRRSPDGRIAHEMRAIVLVARARLLEVHETARWTEPERRDASWQVESSEAEVTPAFAARNLRAILTGLLDALRKALVREVEGRRELEARLGRLAEADRALG